MGQLVVVAEKPSVGRDIARVLGCRQSGDGCLTGGGYTVTWAVGHLVALSEPDELDAKYKRWSFDALPMLPENIPLKVLPATRSQFDIVSDLINADTTEAVICATDAGREGELIFRYIYEKSGCEKPIKRLWINSMTDEAIHEGFAAIRPGEDYDGLYRSAQCRSRADWLVGMNATRAFTLRYDTLLSVGRVQTPTLAILVKRAREIAAFVPEGYATLTADFGDYTGQWFDPRKKVAEAQRSQEGGETAEPTQMGAKTDVSTHLADKAAAQVIAAKIKGKTARVVSAETQRKRDLPPQLYDLTSLQRDANRALGFTADKTLQLAQSLYETRKALTYPRTDSRYLPDDMIPKVAQTMKLLPAEYQSMVPAALHDGKVTVNKRVFDASKVSDHHALLPTANRVDPSRFTPEERQLWDMVVRRMLQAFYPPCEYDATRIVTGCEEEAFVTTGRTVIQQGFRAIDALAEPVRKRKAKGDDSEKTLPPLQSGDERTVKGTTIKEDKTKPPAQHNDASLLDAMEKAGRDSDDEALREQMKGSGIGTPATRAAIIERLIQVGYVARKTKFLLPTEKGMQLIAIMPAQLSSPETTGRWELALNDITTGKQDPQRFMEGIRKLSAFLVSYAHDNRNEAHFPEDPKRAAQRKQYAAKRAASAKKLPGLVCPVCGKGEVCETDRAFICSLAGDGCAFTLWKDCLTRGGGPTLDAKLLTLLLEKHVLRGSTGTIQLTDQAISFVPSGSPYTSVNRPLVWRKRR